MDDTSSVHWLRVNTKSVQPHSTVHSDQRDMRDDVTTVSLLVYSPLWDTQNTNGITVQWYSTSEVYSEAHLSSMNQNT